MVPAISLALFALGAAAGPPTEASAASPPAKTQTAGVADEWLTPVSVYGGIDVGSHLVINTWPLFDPDVATATGQSSAMFALKLGSTIRQAPWLRGDLGIAVIPYESTRGEENTAILYSFDVVYVARRLTSSLLDIDWTPVAGGGLGIYHNVRGSLGHDADLAVHLGVGLRGRINERYRIRASVRDYFSDYIDGEGPGNNLELSVGIELLLLGTDRDEAAALAAAEAAEAAEAAQAAPVAQPSEEKAPEAHPATVETVPPDTPLPKDPP